MPSSRAKLIKTGGDPRLYPAFATLTYEIQKLHHPARPDINWQNASRLCLTLFEANGVELQTAVWFTFCRAHNNGVQGMTEGLSVVTELLIKNGDLCWPESVHARLNLLSDMSRYLQRFLRTQTLSRTDLDTLSQSAVLLAELGEYLQRIGMRQQSQLDVLRDRIMDSVLLLEQRDMSDRIAREITDETGGPPDVHPLSAAMASSPERWVYVSHEKCAPADVSITKRRAFLAGAGAAILSTMMIVAGIYTFMTDPVRDRLMSSVDLFATVLSADTVHQLSVTQPDWLQNDSVWLEKTGEKLDWLTSASPFWLFEHGNALLEQARQVMPDSPVITSMSHVWFQRLSDLAGPNEKSEGWHEGMEKLKGLALKLESLDEKRGKYLTVSELKSVVYSISQAFSKSVPAEEWLRRIESAQGKAVYENMQLQQSVHALQARYGILHAQKPVNLNDSVEK